VREPPPAAPSPRRAREDFVELHLGDDDASVHFQIFPVRVDGQSASGADGTRGGGGAGHEADESRADDERREHVAEGAPDGRHVRRGDRVAQREIGVDPRRARLRSALVPREDEIVGEGIVEETEVDDGERSRRGGRAELRRERVLDDAEHA
jgi:hypothetical protein